MTHWIIWGSVAVVAAIGLRAGRDLMQERYDAELREEACRVQMHGLAECIQHHGFDRRCQELKLNFCRAPSSHDSESPGM